LQQSRSLAHELQEPVILWEQILAVTQGVFSQEPEKRACAASECGADRDFDGVGEESECWQGSDEEEVAGCEQHAQVGPDNASADRVGGVPADVQGGQTETAPSEEHEWCSRLEDLFRESAASGGLRRGTGSSFASNGFVSCECAGRFRRSARRLVATRFRQRLVDDRKEAERLRKTQESLERARHCQLLLLRIQNGEDADDPAIAPEVRESMSEDVRTEEEEDGRASQKQAGLWRQVRRCARACADARRLSSAILSSAATAAYSGLEEWEIEPHRTLVLEMPARSMPSNPLFLDIRAAHHPSCHLLVFSDLLVLRGQPHPEAMRGAISAGWTTRNGRLVRDTSDAGFFSASAADDCKPTRSTRE